MNSTGILSILSKQWASVDDIKAIACCGRDTATNIREDIRNNILKNGSRLPDTKTKFVPMKSVIEYFNIDLEYIYKMAEKEKKLI